MDEPVTQVRGEGRNQEPVTHVNLKYHMFLDTGKGDSELVSQNHLLIIPDLPLTIIKVQCYVGRLK